MLSPVIVFASQPPSDYPFGVALLKPLRLCTALTIGNQSSFDQQWDKAEFGLVYEISTAVGVCHMAGNPERCCNELGLDYVEPKWTEPISSTQELMVCDDGLVINNFNVPARCRDGSQPRTINADVQTQCTYNHPDKLLINIDEGTCSATYEASREGRSATTWPGMSDQIGSSYRNKYVNVKDGQCPAINPVISPTHSYPLQFTGQNAVKANLGVVRDGKVCGVYGDMYNIAGCCFSLGYLYIPAPIQISIVIIFLLVILGIILLIRRRVRKSKIKIRTKKSL